MPHRVLPSSTSTTSSTASLHPFDEDLHPFDERPSMIPLVSRSVYAAAAWQTMPCMQALAALPSSHANIIQGPEDMEEDEDDVFDGLAVSPDHSAQQPSRASQRVQIHPWNLVCPLLETETCGDPSTLSMTPQLATQPPSPPRPLRMPFLSDVETIGPTGSQVYKITLPPHLISLLDPILAVAEAYAQRQGGWSSNLYSLTRQDLAVADIPGAAAYSRPVVDYLTRQMQVLYQSRSIWMDRNQPHLLKYSAQSGYSGVGLHTDACDVTANLMMSRPLDYYGGGTWLEHPCNVTVHLNQGECLLHPGSVRHAGQAIHSGTRYCMLLFGFFEPPTKDTKNTNKLAQDRSGGRPSLS